MTAVEWIAFGCICALMIRYIVLPLVSLSNSGKSKAEQELDDMEQTAAVSRPASLPHVRAGTAYGQELPK